MSNQRIAHVLATLLLLFHNSTSQFQQTVQPPSTLEPTTTVEVTSSVQVTSSDQVTSTTPVTSTAESPTVTTTENSNTYDPNVCSTGGSRAVCVDCKKISVCLNNRALPAKNCPVATPYCVDSELGGYCSDSPDPGRTQCQEKFQCTAEGYFPDPFNCHYFVLCDSNLKGYRHDCMPGYIYSVKTNDCRRQIFPSDCETLDCSKSNGVWGYYGRSKQFYGYCYESSSGSNEVAMFKCGDGSEFDGFQCQFRCRSEGRFADSVNRNRYFECYYVGFKLTARVKTCPAGMEFDDGRRFCVAK
ncbi:uncharacterized protein LOC129722864 [Wyeomyia smithii]|uniref:uncharacterized protein LOC129722864 n=1 Tax=Wyeomyia smithii TaxID=174621 RepID=UPI002467C698|nr:uncharacterized protein LOC129722864 [Wyeomyia smithii]